MEEKELSGAPPRPHDPGRFATTFQHAGPFSVLPIGTGCPEYNPKRSGPRRRPPPLKMGGQMVRAHGTLEEVPTLAAKAGAKKMALTHFTPGEVDVEANFREMGKIYDGQIIFGEDLMEVIA